MLKQTRQALATGRVILASGSPRRQEIIKLLNLQNIEIIPSLYDENLSKDSYSDYGIYVQDIAMYKVDEVYKRLKKDPETPTLIIGADTMVVMDDTIFGKPKDKSEAFKMLSCLANRTHTVYSGVCLKTQEKEINFYESTKVKFGEISAEQIKTFVDTGEPLDKAGAYSVQSLCGCFIEKIDGDFYNVMGLPLYSITKQLNKLFSNI